MQKKKLISILNVLINFYMHIKYMHLYAIYVKIINYIHVYKFYFTMCYCMHKIYRFCYKFTLFLYTYKYKYIHILV